MDMSLRLWMVSGSRPPIFTMALCPRSRRYLIASYVPLTGQGILSRELSSGDPSKYDYEKLGWQFQTLPGADNKYIYNTTLPGYGNYGHTFGDQLSEAERKAVIEYLKTL